MVFELGASLQELRVRRSVVLLLVLVALDPQLASFFLVANDLIETLDTVVKLRFGQFKGFLNT